MLHYQIHIAIDLRLSGKDFLLFHLKSLGTVTMHFVALATGPTLRYAKFTGCTVGRWKSEVGATFLNNEEGRQESPAPPRSSNLLVMASALEAMASNLESLALLLSSLSFFGCVREQVFGKGPTIDTLSNQLPCWPQNSIFWKNTSVQTTIKRKYQKNKKRKTTYKKKVYIEPCPQHFRHLSRLRPEEVSDLDESSRSTFGHRK